MAPPQHRPPPDLESNDPLPLGDLNKAFRLLGEDELTQDSTGITRLEYELAQLRLRSDDVTTNLASLETIRALSKDDQLPEKFLDILKETRKRKETINNQIGALEVRLAEMKALRDSHYSTLPLPVPHEPGVAIIDTEQLKADVPHISEDSKMVSIIEVIKKLNEHGAERGFSEANYKRALGHVLHGAYYECLDANREESLKTIYKILGERFSHKETLVDRTHAIENFVRKEGEPIRECMTRFQMLLDQTASAVPRNIRKARLYFMSESVLKAVCSKAAANNLSMKKSQALARGSPMEYMEMLRIVAEHELHNNFVATAPIPCRVQAHSAVREEQRRESRKRSASPSSSRFDKEKAVKRSTSQSWRDKARQQEQEKRAKSQARQPPPPQDRGRARQGNKEARYDDTHRQRQWQEYRERPKSASPPPPQWRGAERQSRQGPPQGRHDGRGYLAQPRLGQPQHRYPPQPHQYPPQPQYYPPQPQQGRQGQQHQGQPRQGPPPNRSHQSFQPRQRHPPNDNPNRRSRSAHQYWEYPNEYAANSAPLAVVEQQLLFGNQPRMHQTFRQGKNRFHDFHRQKNGPGPHQGGRY